MANPQEYGVVDFDDDGRVLGLDVAFWHDHGAYTPYGLIVPIITSTQLLGPYKPGAYRVVFESLYTNTVMVTPYRGAGRPQGCFVMERTMDAIADALGKDRTDVRSVNFIQPDEFPYDQGLVFQDGRELEYDSGDYEKATEMAKASFGYDELRAEQRRRRESGDKVQLGIGVSTFTEMCGLAPSRVLGSLDYGAGGWEHASVRMLATGKVEIVTGTSAHGQGHETAFSQIVADRLGVPFEDVEVIHGDTQIAHKGLDTYGSRSLVVGG